MADVIIIDDHPMIRMALKMMAEKEGHSVIAEAGEVSMGAAIIKKHNPEVAFIDIDLPPFSGIDLVREMRAVRYTGKIIMMSGKRDNSLVRLSIQVGANGFVFKSNDFPEFAAALRAVNGGYSYFPMPEKAFISAKPPIRNVDPGLASLSERELEIMNYLARGMKNKDIAHHLNISHKTVSAHKVNLMQKLGLTNEVKIAEFVLRHNVS